MYKIAQTTTTTTAKHVKMNIKYKMRKLSFSLWWCLHEIVVGGVIFALLFLEILYRFDVVKINNTGSWVEPRKRSETTGEETTRTITTNNTRVTNIVERGEKNLHVNNNNNEVRKEHEITRWKQAHERHEIRERKKEREEVSVRENKKRLKFPAHMHKHTISTE